MSRFASFQQISGMSASWPAILVGIGSRRATTSGWRHRRVLRGTDGSRKPRISRRTPPRFALNRRTMRACLLADFLGPGQKLRPTTGELPCRVSRRIAAWMAQMVVSIEVARLLLSPPQYPPMHHAQAERRTAHGTARMGPCRHAFPRQSLLHSITKFTPRALVVDQEPSSSAFFSSEAAGSIPRTQPLAPSWLETRDMTA